MNFNWQLLFGNETPEERNKKEIIKKSEELVDACEVGNVEEVKRLLNETQIYLNYGKKHSRTAFYVACQFGHIDIVKLLLNDKRVDINQSDYEEITSFFYCLSE